jgi:nucleoside-diphosphate-sugar epimerase
MTILVTGGTGFIGSHIVRELVEHGEKVVIIDRNRDTRIMKSLGVNLDEVTVTQGDATDLVNLFHTMKKNEVNGVIHLAAILSVKSAANPRLAFDVNVKGVVNLLEVVRIMDVKRVIYISSGSVYGSSQYEPVDEEHPTNSDDLYSATKLFAEMWGLNYGKLYNLEFVSLRLGYVYGSGQQSQPGHRQAVELIESAFFNKKVKWPHGRDHKMNLVYVKDVVRGIRLAYYSKRLEHNIFNISSGKQHTYWELENVIKQYIPDASVEIGSGLIDHEETGLMDISRAKNELGYDPFYTMEEGVKDYVKWLRENKEWWGTKYLIGQPQC